MFTNQRNLSFFLRFRWFVNNFLLLIANQRNKRVAFCCRLLRQLSIGAKGLCASPLPSRGGVCNLLISCRISLHPIPFAGGHHYDYYYLKLPDSVHCKGFESRIRDLRPKLAS